jgi:hypothetical protein
MIKAVATDNIAGWIDCEECDVLEISENAVKVQGIGSGRLFVAKNGEIKVIDIDFSEKSLLTLEI